MIGLEVTDAKIARFREILPLVQEAESSVLIGEGGDFATVREWADSMPAAQERRKRLHALLAELGYPPRHGEDNTGEWEGALLRRVTELEAEVQRLRDQLEAAEYSLLESW